MCFVSPNPHIVGMVWPPSLFRHSFGNLLATSFDCRCELDDSVMGSDDTSTGSDGTSTGSDDTSTSSNTMTSGSSETTPGDTEEQ